MGPTDYWSFVTLEPLLPITYPAVKWNCRHSVCVVNNTDMYCNMKTLPRREVAQSIEFVGHKPAGDSVNFTIHKLPVFNELVQSVLSFAMPFVLGRPSDPVVQWCKALASHLQGMGFDSRRSHLNLSDLEI